MISKKELWIVGIALVAVVFVYVLTYTLGEPGASTVTSEPVVRTGRVVCLPHQDTTGPQTLECALGLETEEDTYYALDVSGLDDAGVALGIHEGSDVTVEGNVIMRDALAADDRWRLYAVDGVIAVTEMHPADAETTARHSFPGGAVFFERPTAFGLAATQEQLAATSYIPVCAEGFDYCLYYTGDEYENTNFEGAGVRLEARPDLRSEQTCLARQPEGYATLTPKTHSTDTYAISVFEQIGDAGAGHYSEGSLFRLFYGSSCYEFETRIAQAQFGNYETGTITEFTDADKEVIARKLRDIIEHIQSSDGRIFFFDAVRN